MYNFIFDLDGTIINSSNEVIECLYSAFCKADYKIDKSKLTSNLIGPPLRQIISNIAPELNDNDKFSEIMSNFREIYDNDENDISFVYDGVHDVLKALKNNGKRLFMATFKPKKPTERIIKQFNLSYFEDIYTVDKFEHPMTKKEMIEDIIQKYGLKKEETVMVGDALSDINAAHDAGIKAIGALWGYGDDKTPLIKNADILIDNMGELCQKLNYQTI